MADGVARLLPSGLDERLEPTDPRWRDWRRLMGRYLVWRRRRWADTELAGERARRSRELHRRFLALCGLQQGCLVLDIGCGSGHVRDLLPASTRYVGLDPLPGGRDPLSGDLPSGMPAPSGDLRFVQGVGEALPFADAAFDAALLMGSLDHSLDPEAVLAEARRVLRPGGTLGVLQGVARPRSAVARLLADLLGRRGAPATHAHRFTLESVVALVGRYYPVRSVEMAAGRALLCAVRDDAR